MFFFFFFFPPSVSASGPTTRSKRARLSSSSSSLAPAPPSSTTTTRSRSSHSAASADEVTGETITRRNTTLGLGTEKGKETELDNMDGAAAADEDDDNDSEDGNGGFMHPNMLSAKLRAGIGSASPSHLNGRMKNILSGLRSEEEEGKQVEAFYPLGPKTN